MAIPALTCNSEILGAALHYISLGWKVLPLFGVEEDGSCKCAQLDCTSPGKHPITPNGLKDASTDEAKVRAWFSVPDRNLGIATGKESGIFVIDVDGSTGEESLERLQKENTELPLTAQNYTGRGRHFIFKHPGYKIKTRASKLSINLDVRGDGGYIVAAPSMHHTGVQYAYTNLPLSEAPEWLLELVKAHEAPDKPLEAYTVDNSVSWDIKDVRNMLSCIDPDMSYDDWVNVGMALHEGGYPLTVWDEWSREGDKYKAGDCLKRWTGFNGTGGVTMGTLVQMAQLEGWHPEPIEVDVTTKKSVANILKNALKPKEEEKPAEIEGIVKDTVDWLVDTAIKPQPELALLNTIAALGAIFGRRYASPLNTRTNVYMVGIAGTGAGKDHSRRQLKELMFRAGHTEKVGGDSVVSGAGLITGLVKKPSQLMSLDEIGLMLQETKNKNSQGYMRIVNKILLELYSSSGATYLGGQYADAERDATIIECPNLCIYGTSTLNEFAEALSSRGIENGQLNRFICMRAKEDLPKRRRGFTDHRPGADLVEAWKNLLPKGGNLTDLGSSSVSPEVITVLWGDTEERIYNMGDFEDEKMREGGSTAPLWNRYRENAIKLAMIFAITRNKTRPEINHKDLDNAEKIVKQSIEFMEATCTDYISDNDYEDLVNKIVRVLKSHGKEMSFSALANKLPGTKSRERNDAIADLCEREKALVIKEETSGRPKKTLRLL